MMKYCFALPGSIPCSDIDADQNTLVININKTFSRMSMIFKCQDGYIFADGSTFQKITCLFTTGQWSPGLASYIGEINLDKNYN